MIRLHLWLGSRTGWAGHHPRPTQLVNTTLTLLSRHICLEASVSPRSQGDSIFPIPALFSCESVSMLSFLHLPSYDTNQRPDNQSDAYSRQGTVKQIEGSNECIESWRIGDTTATTCEPQSDKTPD